MNDDERELRLDSLLAELSGAYQSDLDVERGLDRLRKAGHGLPGPDNVNVPRDAEQAPRPISRPSRPRAKLMADLRDPLSEASVDGTIAVLEGILLPDRVVEVDLTKVEAPTSRALIAPQPEPLRTDVRPALRPAPRLGEARAFALVVTVVT